MEKFEVRILQTAEQDLYDIINWIAQNDSPEKAHRLLDKLIKSYQSLKDLPLRGHKLPELKQISTLDYLEIHQGPYRIIYQVQIQTVYIHAVLDGRRELADLLESRLLR